LIFKKFKVQNEKQLEANLKQDWNICLNNVNINEKQQGALGGEQRNFLK